MPEQSLRLALMSSQSQWGGGEQFLWTLGNGLENRGHEIIWITPKSSKLANRVRARNLQLYTLSGRRPSPLSLLGLRNNLRKNGVQVLHLNDSHAVTWGALATLGTAKIARVSVKHTVFPIRSAAKYNCMIDEMVCVSEAVRKTATKGGINHEKLRVIYNGLERPDLLRTDQRYFVAEQLRVPIDSRILVAAGSLIPCKNYDLLIEAVDQLRLTIPNICLAICGEGIQQAQLQNQIEQRQLQRHVRLVGFQHEPERWIAGADVFVHPSSSEGLSLVSVQSQMIGTPVVAMDVGGLSEVLRSSTGELTGWICKEPTVSALSLAIYSVINSDQSEMQNANLAERTSLAQREAIERFSVEQMLDGYENCYRELACSRMHRRRQSQIMKSRLPLQGFGCSTLERDSASA